MRFLKTIFRVSLIALIFAPSLSNAWMNDVFFIKGNVKSFDKNTVRILDSQEQIVVVPREAVPKNFKLSSGTTTKVPVYTKYVLQVKSGRMPAGKKLPNPTATFEKLVNDLKLDYQKTVNSR